jgi:hypothetical protein
VLHTKVQLIDRRNVDSLGVPAPAADAGAGR